MLTPVNNPCKVSDILNFTSQCAIQTRRVPLNAFPKQVKKLFWAIELISRKVCTLQKDVKNKILRMCINDIAGPAPALNHLLKDTKNSVFFSHMLKKFEINPEAEIKALQALQEANLFAPKGEASVLAYREHFDLKNTEGKFSSSSDVADKEFLLGVFHFMVQFGCLPSQFDQKNIDMIKGSNRQVYLGSQAASVYRIINRKGKLLHLPVNVTNSKNTQILSVCDTKISSLPLQLARLSTLNCLDMSHTKITALPIVIALLNQLTVLKLNHTDVSELPNWITNLPLEELHIENTKITSLSAFFREMFPTLSLYCAGTNLSREGEQGDYLLQIDTYSQFE